MRLAHRPTGAPRSCILRAGRDQQEAWSLPQAIGEHRARRWLCAALVAAATSFAPAHGSERERTLGAEAYRRGDHDQAAAIWRPLAEDGDAYAQFGMGLLYYSGDGVPRDLTESARWFRLSAEQGYGAAQHNLGNAYKHGRGVPLDDAEAARWWRLAAEQDYAAAQFNLALQYHYGRGVEADDEVALDWMRRAAGNGHAEAIAILAEAGDDRGALTVTAAGAGTVKAPGGRRLSRDERWILAQDPKAFTLQLLATREEAAMKGFLTYAPAPSPSAVFRFERDGEAWFALIQGAYPSRGAAERAIEALPEVHRRGKPWIRSFSEVQSLLGR